MEQNAERDDAKARRSPSPTKDVPAIIIMNSLFLLALLYLFISSLTLLADAFTLLSGKLSSGFFRDVEILQDPIMGVMLGTLVTALFQSSSTTTSIVVAMVSSKILDVQTAIPMVMGANIGTSVTNTMVSLTHLRNDEEFHLAFQAATVHDLFNSLTCISLLTVEVLTGYLQKLSKAAVDLFHLEGHKETHLEILKIITKPFTNLVVQIDKNVLQAWLLGKNVPESLFKYANKTSMLKEKCSSQQWMYAVTNSSNNNTEIQKQLITITEDCHYLFQGSGLSDANVGAIILAASFAILCITLVLIVKILNSMLKGHIAVAVKRVINADIPCAPWITGYLAILVGCFLTIIVQSSSIFTSILTPMAGIGIVDLERLYPLTLGSNIGTTTTAILASLTASSDSLSYALQISFCHLFFNVTGVLMFYTIPCFRFPIPMSRALGKTASKYKWFAIFYLAICFVLLPLLAFALSFINSVAVIAVFVPLIGVFLLVCLVNRIQSVKPQCLPPVLRTWGWLPRWMRSLKPMDECLDQMICKEQTSGDRGSGNGVVIENPTFDRGESVARDT